MLSREQKVEKIQHQIDEIERIKTSQDFKKWRRDTEIVVENVFGVGTRHTHDFSQAFLNFDLAVRYSDVVDYREFIFNESDAFPVLRSFLTEFEKFEDVSSESAPRNSLAVIERLCKRFHLVARQLRNRYNNRETIDIEDEYDVQDLFHALLALEFDDIRPEEWAPSYAGSSSRTDFLLKQEKIVVEIKKIRKGLLAKQIGEQLIIDIMRYRSHPDCHSLVCFVYDPEGRIANPRGIENDLNRRQDNVDVKVIIAPSGV